jgi:hypothetical protein
MARNEVKRWRCKNCDAINLEAKLLVGRNPFDDLQKVLGCPDCFEVFGGDCEEVCDEPGCTRQAGCGFPAGPEWGGYRRTCSEHFAPGAVCAPSGASAAAE